MTGHQSEGLQLPNYKMVSPGLQTNQVKTLAKKWYDTKAVLPASHKAIWDERSTSLWVETLFCDVLYTKTYTDIQQRRNDPPNSTR